MRIHKARQNGVGAVGKIQCEHLAVGGDGRIVAGGIAAVDQSVVGYGVSVEKHEDGVLDRRSPGAVHQAGVSDDGVLFSHGDVPPSG